MAITRGADEEPTDDAPATEDAYASLAAARVSRRASAPDEDAAAQKGGSDDRKGWPPQAEGQLTVDVFQTATEIVVQSTVGGVRPSDIDITIANDMVSIRGTRVRDEEIPEENFYYQECYWGPFSRSIILPAEVKGEDAEASLKDGLLTIRLPKAEKEKVKKIPVRISS